ncbi:MAG: ABC transporter ATP-binding protein [Candidatus Limimorpha sp.]|nr:ABC transporter ATP-binding protein [Bacteroidales bacterium]
MIQANGIYKSFGNVDVIKGIDLHINKGEIVAIVGASGAGKSTLLQILGTLDKPDKGKVIIDNQDITSLNQKNLASFRNKKIGFVFQFHHLLPEFTALENICIPAFIAGMPKKEAADKAMALLEYLRLTERASHKPSMLSGGEQQRVAIARALINNPAIILADEPSGNLDSQNAKELHELFFSLREKTGQTFVIVTHNPSLANMADRALTIVDGKIEHNN